MTAPEVRAITVRPPWAQAIAWGAKTVENRGARFPSRYRGPVLIHAGSAWSHRGAADPRVVDTARRAPDPPAYWTAGAIDSTGVRRSAVLAVADLVDVHPATAACVEPGGGCDPWGETSYEEAGGRRVEQVTHLVLDEVRRLSSPVDCREGHLGLWRPPPWLVAAVSDRLGSEALLHARCETCGSALVRRSGRLDGLDGDWCGSAVCGAPA